MRFKADFLSCFNLFAKSVPPFPRKDERRAKLPVSLLSLSLIGLSASLLAGCDEVMSPPGLSNARAHAPLSHKTLTLMSEHGTTSASPVLIRTYKKEAELEIWKMGADGRYKHLKTYPMCRWSGQLGPKMREGDRQVPEGFYAITPAQMHPNSHYYLSFDVGYPNTFDRAWGRSGGSIMVHGVCSSAGCFSMTDEQIEEIYAIVREGFAGGQRAIQMQSYPFRMTAENLAKYRLDPNIAFWRQLKEGADHFDLTRQEVIVGVCDRHYIFNALPAGGSFDPTGACPPVHRNAEEAAEVAARTKRDEEKIAEFAARGVKPVHTVYADGGQHPSFSTRQGEVSRPEALAQAPVDYDMDEGKPNPKNKKDKFQPAVAAPVTGPAVPTQAMASAQPQPATAGGSTSGPASPAVSAGSQAPAQAAQATAPTQQAEATGSSFFNMGRFFNWKSADKPTDTPADTAVGSIQPAVAPASPVNAKVEPPAAPAKTATTQHPAQAVVPAPRHKPAPVAPSPAAEAVKPKPEEKTVKAASPVAQATAELATVATVTAH
ncbi:protein of unknown function DUF949 [Beijerinckia indica subsp. indica ATCC 9039]|uniref:L,D-TPase catalytic domain-containing protein n=2 Tax=Beijerinckia TaxID=532 RepID=B2IKD4_BEII9|nr:protein of unknown function DUF949 [Beijerinckia indica subsp. indica ATCC 9039]